MQPDTIKDLFNKDLNKLKEELIAFKNESSIWKTEGAITNSAGNLCLHIVGNLNAYIGVGLAKTNYTRARDQEFSLKNIPREDLINKIDHTIKVVVAGLNNLSEKEMEGNFPIIIWDSPTGMEFTLMRLLTHLNYHVGQINYVRRIIDSKDI